MLVSELGRGSVSGQRRSVSASCLVKVRVSPSRCHSDRHTGKKPVWSEFIGSTPSRAEGSSQHHSNPCQEGRTDYGRTDGGGMADDDDWESAWDSGVSLPDISPNWPATNFSNRPLRLVWQPKNNPTKKRSGNEIRKYGSLRINPFRALTSFC